MSSPTQPVLRRPAPALLALSLGYFTLGTASLASVGLTTQIGAELDVRPATVGTLVTVFALVFAVGAPVAAVLLGPVCRKRVLQTGLALMLLGGTASALAPNFAIMVAARVVAGLGAAFYGPTASAAGSQVVPQERRPQALATVFAGMTVATVLGVPLASAAGNMIGWRWTMGVVVLLTLAATVLVTRLLPGIPAESGPTLRVFVDALRVPGVLPIAGTTMLLMATQFTVYGVAGAYLAERFGASPTWISLTLFVFGVTGTAGNLASARAFERIGGVRTAAVPIAGLAVAFTALPLVPASVGWGMAVLACWAFFANFLVVPQQTRLVALAPGQRAILLALNASGLYLGMSAGSLIGSTLLPVLGARQLPLVGLALVGLAAAVHLVSARSPAAPAEPPAADPGTAHTPVPGARRPSTPTV
ncbi:MFS transporter [Streptomyces sp. NPDC001665]